MNNPFILLGFLISTLFGAIFHLLRGGGAGRLLLYLILAWSGFWIGQGIASLFNWSFGSLGDLHIVFASASSLAFLGVGYWLSLTK